MARDSLLPMKNSRKSGGDAALKKSVLLGAKVDGLFFSQVEAAAKKLGMTRSNFVRRAVADAVAAAGGNIPENAVSAYQGQQCAARDVVAANAAGARAVRDSLKNGTHENAIRARLKRAGYGDACLSLYFYARGRAENSAGRALTEEEDAEFLSSAQGVALDRERDAELRRAMRKKTDSAEAESVS